MGSAYEQKVEPPDRKWQYLLFAAEPYETIAFKVPSREVDKSEQRFWSHWNKDFLQFSFKLSDPRGGSAVARPPPPAMVPAPPKPVPPPSGLPPPPMPPGPAAPPVPPPS